MKLAFAAPAIALLGSLALACGGSPTAEHPSATPDAGSTASAPAAPAQAIVMGGGCTPITESYSICSEITSCPGLTIDRTKFPDCGYSVHGNVLDPECLCYGSMCPMGAPQTCTDMQGLLSTVTIDGICAQYASGKCLNEGAIGGTDCSVCEANCNGNIACVQACGC
jgi:hypothetical protein